MILNNVSIHKVFRHVSFKRTIAGQVRSDLKEELAGRVLQNLKAEVMYPNLRTQLFYELAS